MTSVLLRHLRHALSIEPHFADTFDSREDVINRLASDTDQFRAHNARHEIAGQIENFLRSRVLESFAKDRRHGAGKRLHFRAERHADVRPAIFIDVQVNAHGVGAFLVFSDVNKVELLAFARLLVLRVIRVQNERFAPLIFRQRFKKVDDLIQLRRIHRDLECTVDSLPVIPSEVEESRGVT